MPAIRPMRAYRRLGLWPQPCLDAGLDLLADAGTVFTDGEIGPFRPYLPSGAFL
jgi:hypothetical protein